MFMQEAEIFEELVVLLRKSLKNISLEKILNCKELRFRKLVLFTCSNTSHACT